MHSTRKAGFAITVPSSVKVYNKGKAKVTPTVKKAAGLHRDVVAVTANVYSGKHRVAHGRSVKVRAGTYSEATTVRYRAYRLLTKYKTVTKQQYHIGPTPSDTPCTVTAINDADWTNSPTDGQGFPTAATCTTPQDPKNAYLTSEDDFFTDTFYTPDGTELDTNDLGTSTVGEVLITDDVSFPDWTTTVTKQVPYTVKQYTRYGSFVTKKQRLHVIDAGYRYTFGGVGDENGTDFYTRYFAVPRHWTLNYTYNCANTDIDWGNWIVDVQRKGAAPYTDTNVANELSAKETRAVRMTGAGTIRLHVYTECVWAITAHWK